MAGVSFRSLWGDVREICQQAAHAVAHAPAAGRPVAGSALARVAAQLGAAQRDVAHGETPEDVECARSLAHALMRLERVAASQAAAACAEESWNAYITVLGPVARLLLRLGCVPRSSAVFVACARMRPISDDPDAGASYASLAVFVDEQTREIVGALERGSRSL